jgi:hypothetical protein
MRTPSELAPPGGEIHESFAAAEDFKSVKPFETNAGRAELEAAKAEEEEKADEDEEAEVGDATAVDGDAPFGRAALASPAAVSPLVSDATSAAAATRNGVARLARFESAGPDDAELLDAGEVSPPNPPPTAPDTLALVFDCCGCLNAALPAPAPPPATPLTPPPPPPPPTPTPPA